MATNFKLDMGCMERDEDKTEFLSACSRLDQKTIYEMVDVKGVEAGAAVDSIEQNCLHFVVCSVNQTDLDRQAALVHFLVQKGADVNQRRSTDGWTPLFLAVVFGMAPMVQVLLQQVTVVSLYETSWKIESLFFPPRAPRPMSGTSRTCLPRTGQTSTASKISRTF